MSKAIAAPIGAGALLIAVSLAVLVDPSLATIAVGVFVAIVIAISLYSRLPEIALSVLGICLIGYAFLGRGFAYLGFPPVYVGEVALGIGLLALLLRGGLGQVFRSPISWALVMFMLLGLGATVPYISEYGLFAFRDAAAWGYGVFAFVSAAFLLKTSRLPQAIRSFAHLIPWYLTWVAVSKVATRLNPSIVPSTPGSDVPIVHLKSGDVGVHLAGILAFLVLGLQQVAGVRTRDRDWITWLAWFIAFGQIFNNRGGVFTVIVVVSALLLLVPSGQWGKLLAIGSLVVVVFVSLDIEIPLGPMRSISAKTLIITVESLVRDTNEADYDGTRKWRLNWWSDIVDYTLFGEYFWTGKGYGVNLADSDGYQVAPDHTLRSPHNGHMTFLARGGIPSAVAWILLQGLFAFQLVRAMLRARKRGERTWASVNVWILMYWLAFMVNGTFDVFLEGPQGGIWFWSLFGMGIAALETQRPLGCSGSLARTAARRTGASYTELSNRFDENGLRSETGANAGSVPASSFTPTAARKVHTSPAPSSHWRPTSRRRLGRKIERRA